MAEASADRDRPPRAQLYDLNQIRYLPGACRQTWEIPFMLAVLPIMERAICERSAERIVPIADYERVGATSLLLLARIRYSLWELMGAARGEAEGKIPEMKGTPLHRRQFTFSEIAYLASGSMVELGRSHNDGRPDEAERIAITTEVLDAAPLVCGAFNGTIALLSLPLQRSAVVFGPENNPDIPQPRGPLFSPDHHTS